MKRFDVEKKFGEGNTIGGVFVKNFVKNYSIAHIQIQGCPFDSYLIKGRYQKSNGAARVGEFVLDAISMSSHDICCHPSFDRTAQINRASKAVCTAVVLF